MSNLRVGDSVLWRGGWGNDPEKSVRVKAIQVNESNGSKYGEDTQSVGWADVVERKVLVDLDNEHWAWADQIRPDEGATSHQRTHYLSLPSRFSQRTS
jgi:hypothetical protein